jgi:uncharacterized phage protein gp47/JayE
MPLNIPDNSEEVIQRAKTDVRRAWVGSNPFLKNSAIAAIIIGFANRVYDFYLQLKEAIKQSFPDTATDQFLERWAAIYGINRLAATKSIGNVIATGTLGSTVPLGSVYAATDGILYTTTDAINITNTALNILSLSRVGETAFAVTAEDHNLASNVVVTILGAVETEYNGAKVIKVTSANEFTYAIGASVITPATGTITVEYNTGIIPIESSDFQDSENDINVNLILDTPISLQSPLAGIDDIANVDFFGITGGVDQESNANLRLRLLNRLHNPISNFNVAAIEEQAKLINGVTRVFVQSITPDVGQVTTYFMRDNDEDPIPTPTEVQTVKDSILLIMPAQTIVDDVIVNAPIAEITNYDFSELTPNTVSMQAAIDASLEQFYKEDTIVGVDITSEKYIAAIQDSVDSGGSSVQTFTLSSPVGDIPIANNEIGIFGETSFP